MKRQSRRPSARVSRPGPALAEEVATAEMLHELAIERLQNRLKPSIPGARNSDRARAPDRSSRIGAVRSRRRVRLSHRLYGQGEASLFVSQDVVGLAPEDPAEARLVVRQPGGQVAQKDPRGLPEPDLENAPDESAHFGDGWFEPRLERRHPVSSRRQNHREGSVFRGLKSKDFRIRCEGGRCEQRRGGERQRPRDCGQKDGRLPDPRAFRIGNAAPEVALGSLPSDDGTRKNHQDRTRPAPPVPRTVSHRRFPPSKFRDKGARKCTERVRKGAYSSRFIGLKSTRKPSGWSAQKCATTSNR